MFNEKEKNLEVQTNAASRPDYENEISQIIKGNYSPKILEDMLGNYHENDIAEVLCDISASDRKRLFRILDTPVLAEIFEYVTTEDACGYLFEMDIKKAVSILSSLESDSAADILKELPKEKRELIISLTDDETRKQIELFASFDEDEIGSRMSDNYVHVSRDFSVKQAMSSLIAQAKENDNISTVFVTDENNRFYGAIELKDLIIARESDELESVISTSFPYVYAYEAIDDCIEKLKDYSENSIPVLDDGNLILGVITSQELIEVIDDEMGEDYAMFAGLTNEEDLSEPLKDSLKKRMPWLFILLVLGMGVSSVVGIFEKVVEQLTIIMAFQSLILDMAGNVGTQSLAVTIRVLTDENLSFGKKLKLFFKELKVGMCSGLILGIVSILFVGLYILIFKGKEASFAFAVSGCIGVSLLAAIMISSAVGTLTPMLFKKMKIDPAVASGPLITTINDLVAVITYYGLSRIFLIDILHLAG